MKSIANSLSRGLCLGSYLRIAQQTSTPQICKMATTPITQSGLKWQSSALLCSQARYGFAEAIEFPRSRMLKPKMPVHQFLHAQQLDYVEAANVYKIKYCPFCPKPHHEDRTNLYVLSLQKEYGYFNCFRCSAKGNWLEFRERVLGHDSVTAESILSDQNHDSRHPRDQSRGAQADTKLSEVEYYFYKQNLWSEQYKEVLQYVKSRGFSEQTIKVFNLGAGTGQFYDEDGDSQKVKLVYFPVYKRREFKNSKEELMHQFQKKDDKNFTYNNNWSELAKVKMRGASKQTKRYMRQYPLGGSKGLFGYHLVKDTDDTVVVTEGEFDAMAVYQQTGYPAVSLPQGASNLPEVLVPYFDRFAKIILWMDNDEAGLLNTQKIAQKLGLKRTYIVKHTVPKLKDANDFLINSPALISGLFNKARTIPDANIIGFEGLRESIKEKLVNQDAYRGAKVTWLPFFNQKVKGVRLGELTVVSGPTGSGKTTFLSQLFLDICQRDIGVLWGSFEIRNEVLVTHMLKQFSGINLGKNIQKFEYYADGFQKLPLHLMNFFGSTNIEKIISTIVYSIEKYHIHMVVIDTLQFLLSQQAEGFKKFELQDSLMAKLREISIKFNVHIAIVIHPRKTEDGQDIGIHSIYGTSKSTQEADNIWIIQNRDGFKILDIKKNRFDGELGRIPLGFNRETKCFFQLKRAEFEALRLKEKTMGDIIKEREEGQMGQKSMSQEELLLLDEEIQDHELVKKAKSNIYKKTTEN